jgi:hypothetical protein
MAKREKEEGRGIKGRIKEQENLEGRRGNEKMIPYSIKRIQNYQKGLNSTLKRCPVFNSIRLIS